MACKKNEDEEDTSPNYGNGQQNGADIPSGDPDTDWESDLNEGASIELSFAQEVFCWPGNEDANFDGAHVFFEVIQEVEHNITVVATPEKGLDISLYILQMGPDTTSIPPDLTEASAIVCEASYDQQDDHNPGASESVFQMGWDQSYRVVIGVAGADNVTSGQFKLEVWQTPWG